MISIIKLSTTAKSVAQKNLDNVYHRFQRNHSVLRRTNTPKTEQPFINKEAPQGKYWNKDIPCWFKFSTFKQQEVWSKYVKIMIGLGISLLAIRKAKHFYSVSYCEEVHVEEERKPNTVQSVRLSDIITKARDLLQRIKDETGSPGLVVGVSVNGENIWTEGLGYSDVENRTPCTPDTVFRIASISKPITMGMLAKLWENGDLDLDKPVQHYLPQFPVKYFEGQKVEITTRQLVSHLGGIRHYEKDYMKKNAEIETTKDEKKISEKSPPNEKEKKEENNKNISSKGSNDVKNDKKTEDKEKKREFDNKEYYIKKHYKSVTKSLTLFQDDPLVHKPGTKFLYTSHGWTLISAVMEKAANKEFDKLMMEYFKSLGLQHTYLEENDPLIYHRGRHYLKNMKGRLVNAPYVDNSYKWAGGGLISDVTDLLKFGNIMLYSYQQEVNSYDNTESLNKGDNLKKDNQSDSNNLDQVKESNRKGDNSEKKLLPGFLKKETMDTILSPIAKDDKDQYYGMGWYVVPEKYENGLCKHQRHFVAHTGGAIGASSILLILPTPETGKQDNLHCVEKYGKQSVPPRGVVVTIVVNIGSVNLTPVALEIAKLFDSDRLTPHI